MAQLKAHKQCRRGRYLYLSNLECGAELGLVGAMQKGLLSAEKELHSTQYKCDDCISWTDQQLYTCCSISVVCICDSISPLIKPWPSRLSRFKLKM